MGNDQWDDRSPSRVNQSWSAGGANECPTDTRPVYVEMLEIGSDSDTHTKHNQHDLAEATRVCVGSDYVPSLIPILSSVVEDIDQKELETAHPKSLSAMVSVAIG